MIARKLERKHASKLIRMQYARAFIIGWALSRAYIKNSGICP
jgi:hypothetical protein